MSNCPNCSFGPGEYFPCEKHEKEMEEKIAAGWKPDYSKWFPNSKQIKLTPMGHYVDKREVYVTINGKEFYSTFHTDKEAEKFLKDLNEKA